MMTQDKQYYADARAGKLDELRCDSCKHFNKYRYCKKLKRELRTTDAIIHYSSICGENTKGDE